MKYRLIAVFVALIAAVSMQVMADQLTLTRVSGGSVNIGGKMLKAGDTFNDASAIKWTDSNQKIEAKNRQTGGIYRFSAKQFASKNGISSVKDFFLRVNKASTRNIGTTDVKFTPSGVSSSFPEKRIALIIANTNYTNITSLRNPIYDGESIAESLGKLGFDVIEGYDCDYTDMVSALNQFASKSKDYDVAMFYYSGHGIQEDGHNYLVPVSANLEFKSELARCIDAYDVLERMENSGAKSRIVCLDACRDVKTSWTRSASRGLTTMEGAPGTAIVCSTRSGQVALDGDTDNSPFAASFINALNEKGRNFSDMMNRVGQATYQATAAKQCPIVSGMLLEDFVFNPSGTQIAQVRAKASAPAAGNHRMSDNAGAVPNRNNSGQTSTMQKKTYNSNYTLDDLVAYHGGNKNNSEVSSSRPAAQPAEQSSSQPARSAGPRLIPVKHSVPGYDIRISEGRRVGRNVWIDVIFTNNNNKSDSFGFCGKEPCAGYDDYLTGAWDEYGDSYMMQGGDITVMKGNEMLYKDIVTPSGVPVKYSLLIKNVPENVSMLTMLSMAFRGLMPGEYYGQALMKVRNVPIR